MTRAIWFALLTIGCGGQSIEQVDLGPSLVVIQPWECLVVHRYDARVPYSINGMERPELCSMVTVDPEFNGPIAVQVADASVSLEGLDCVCDR